MMEPTCLEKRMYAVLTAMGVDFTEQLSTRSGFVLDFAIYVDREHDKKLAIEVDGAVWHNKRRDAFRDRILRKEGWRVLRFGETFTPDEAREKIAATLIELRG